MEQQTPEQIVHTPLVREDLDCIDRNRDNLWCPQCLIKVPSLVALQRHLFQEIGSSGIFSCCDTTFSCYKSMLRHQQRAHLQLIRPVPTPPAARPPEAVVTPPYPYYQALLMKQTNLPEQNPQCFHSLFYTPTKPHASLTSEEFEAIEKNYPRIACPRCPTICSSSSEFEKHMTENGAKKFGYCEPCNTFFSTYDNFKDHQTTATHSAQTDPQSLTQVDCPAHIVHTQLGLKDLDFIDRNEGNLSCPQCTKKVSSIAELTRHISQEIKSSDIFSCCDKNFWSYNSMRLHHQYNHSQPAPSTEPLNAREANLSIISHSPITLAQRRTIDQAPDTKCPHCSEVFPNLGKLEQHILAKSENKYPYYCELCNQNLTVGHFSSHQKTTKHRDAIEAEKAKKSRSSKIATPPAQAKESTNPLPPTLFLTEPTPAKILLPSGFTPTADLFGQLPLSFSEDPTLSADQQEFLAQSLV